LIVSAHQHQSSRSRTARKPVSIPNILRGPCSSPITLTKSLQLDIVPPPALQVDWTPPQSPGLLPASFTSSLTDLYAIYRHHTPLASISCTSLMLDGSREERTNTLNPRRTRLPGSISSQLGADYHTDDWWLFFWWSLYPFGSLYISGGDSPTRLQELGGLDVYFETNTTTCNLAYFCCRSRVSRRISYCTMLDCMYP
jgi:hypothetical protein